MANVEQYLALHCPERKLKNKFSGPLPNGYASEMDVTPELDAERANYYQPQVGILHWIVEIGRVDIITEASHMAIPRKGHLDTLSDVFCYLKRRHNSRLVFDPTYLEIDWNVFVEHDWQHFYGDVSEAIPQRKRKWKSECLVTLTMQEIS